MDHIGQRIKQARLAAGISQAELARRAAPLSAMAVSNYERCQDTPRASVLLRLAQALGVAPEFFFRAIDVQLANVQYRRRSNLPKTAQASIQEQVRERLERYLDVERVVNGTDTPGAPLAAACATPIRTPDEAEDAASRLRDNWDLGTDPIGSLTEVLEDHGVRVLLLDAPEDFDGLSCWANHTIPVIVSNRRKPWDRVRSNQAHELGELLMGPAEGGRREKLAQRFAGAFIVPREAVTRELGETRHRLAWDELVLLKEEYGLSMQAWVRRAFDCGVITPTYYTDWCRCFSASGLRKDEHTDPRPVEEPRRFPRLVYRAEAEGLITPAKRAYYLQEKPAPTRPRPSEPELRAASENAAAYPLGDEDRAWLGTFGEGATTDAQPLA